MGTDLMIGILVVVQIQLQIVPNFLVYGNRVLYLLMLTSKRREI